jgi:uncharacterized membrane protein YgcG
VPAASRFQADSVPGLVSTILDAIDMLRERWLSLPIGGPGATVRGRWTALLLSTLVVFACFFALGRITTSSGRQVDVSPPAALEGSAARAAIPVGLSGASPAAGAVPVAIVAKPSPTPRPAQRSVARPLPVEAPTVSTAAPPPATVASPERAPNVTPTPAPTVTSTPAPKPSESSSGSSSKGSAGAPSSGGSRSGGHGSGAAGSPGSSFDSSE